LTNTEIIIPNTDFWSGNFTNHEEFMAALDNRFIQKTHSEIRNTFAVMEKHFSGVCSRDHQQIIMTTAGTVVIVLSIV
tara:strand:- start:401 stop:634 length:234 start_codon:yes stop_codon:yes gene_type:complete